MDNKKVNYLVNKLNKKGFKAEKIHLIGCEAVKIDTNYEGLYPGKIQFDILDYIRKTYGKKYTVEQRGHYTAIFIY